MTEQITLRPELPEDEKFSYDVYASTRADELALTGWTQEQKDAFTRMQFEAQRKHYRQYFPQCAFDVILRAGVPAGRLYVDRRENEIYIVDIAILPEHRNAGIGGGLLRGLLAEAERGGKTVTIHVEQFNPAQKLYRRLGFEQTGVDGIYYRMKWQPKEPRT